MEIANCVYRHTRISCDLQKCFSNLISHRILPARSVLLKAFEYGMCNQLMEAGGQTSLLLVERSSGKET